MFRKTGALSRTRIVLAALFLTFCVAAQAWAGSTTLVISQIYGAGGNSGAVLDSDYVELFNLGSQPVSLNNYSVQYMSSAQTATSASNSVILPNVTLMPGQYYLIQGVGGTTCKSATPACPALPKPDISSDTLSMAAGNGKVFLVSTTALLTGVSPSGTAAASSCTVPSTVVDYVGFGPSPTSCAEGGKDTSPSPTTAQAVIRTNPCTDTDVNGNDFSNGTPNPHNLSSTFTPCGSSTPTGPSITASVTPSSQISGLTVLLTAVPTAGTNPASTGLGVTADLSAFGGSTKQVLLDDGLNGDAVANDGTYSYKLTIPTGQAPAPYKIATTVSDSQLRTGTTTTTLTVTAPVTFIPIHTIQGSMGTGMTAPTPSPYVGQTVQTSGIVTGVIFNGYYIQAPDAQADSDPTTPEGLFVFTGTGLVPPTATVGALVQVTGTAALYPTGETLAGLELNNPTGFSVINTGNPLPAPIALTTTFPDPNGGTFQLMRVQSMRVSVPTSFTATEGTQGFLSEANETYTSNGQFYGTVTGIKRPSREAGLEVLDPLTASYPNIQKYDDNPEVIAVDSFDLLGGTAKPIDLATGAVLTNMTGVMDFSGIEYSASGGSGPQLGAGPVFMVDPIARPTVTGGMTVVAVPAAKAGELTIGDQNMERFYNDQKDTTGAVVVTTPAYQLRLAKASLGIRNVLGTPDVLCMEEIENIAVLNDLSAKITADALAAGQPDPAYVPYLTQGNDGTGINVAFLVKPAKVTVNDVTQFGKTTMFTGNAGSAILNDRPPLVMHMGVKRAGAADYPVTIIVNHLRSLNGATDNNASGGTVRIKREQQAEFLANLIQGYQSNGEHLLVVGDMNAFEFNDGIADSMDIVRGLPTNSNQDIVLGPSAPIVTTPLVDLAPTDVANGVYSYVFVGDGQSIDHFFASADIADLMRTAPAHWNADFPVIYRNDATRPEASSDHDGIVGYLAVPVATSISLSTASLTFGTQSLNTPSASQPVVVTNTGTTAITFSGIAPSAGFTETDNCTKSPLSGGSSCTINVVFQPTQTGAQMGTLTLTDSDATKTQTVSLSGTGGAALISAILLTANPTSAVAGASVALTATVSGNGANPPSGMVTFLNSGTSIGTAQIAAGVATFTTKTLPVGSNSITAMYNGDNAYPSITTGAPVVVTITAAPVPDFTFSISNSTITTTGSSQSGTAQLNVAFINGFNQSVSFICAGLPSNSHCTFSPASLTASGTSVLTVAVNQASLAAPSEAPFRRNGGIALALLFGLPLMLSSSVRSKLRNRGGLLVVALLMGVALTSLSGCGGSASTNKGTTTVTVTATGGSISHTATFTLNVQ